ncbi:MAG: FeoB-associated Cys-rich membrane protein [Firmicutes bacterium]|jgi:hypothetical protein|nr:FeoB-associated Cys-rich membrane protein [Bacillota bacterium]
MIWLDFLLIAILAFVVYRIIKKMRSPNAPSCSSSCGSCTQNCAFRDLAQNQTNTSPYLTVPKKE